MQLYKIFFTVYESEKLEVYSEFYYKQGAAQRDLGILNKAYAGKKKFLVGKVVWDLRESKISSSEPEGIKLKPGTAQSAITPTFVSGE